MLVTDNYFWRQISIVFAGNMVELNYLFGRIIIGNVVGIHYFLEKIIIFWRK